MTSKTILYKDTYNYAPIDVSKGIDLLTKQIVKADDVAPINYKLKPRCKYCKNYLPSQDDNIGICNSSKDKFIAYSEMSAITCNDYIENQ